jgi:diguanylate cyclase (GGDEF)-like protein/excisionase family DNA binding protein
MGAAGLPGCDEPMPDSDADSLLSVAQAAALLGVHPNTIRAWTDAGRLTAFRINVRGDRRFRRGDVIRLLVEDGVSVADAGPEGPNADRFPDLAIFSRIAAGLAIAPTIGSVARTVVEAVRTELRAERVAVYAMSDGQLLLAAHAGFAAPPPTSADPDAGGDDDDARLLLATRRGTTGLLVVDRPTAEAMAPSFRESLLTIAATALAGARVLGRARRDLQRTRALSAVTRELAGELDLTRVLDDIIERTRTLFGADRAGLWQFDDDRHPAALVTRGLSDEFLAHSAALTMNSQTIGVQAHREGKAMWRRNADRDDSIGEMRLAYAGEGIRTVCIVPLRSRGHSIGVLGLYHDTDRSWPEEEVSLVQAFADQAAIAIGNARLYRSVAEQAARIRSIQDLSARLNRLTDVRAIGQAIVDEASTLADYHDIRIYRVDWERRMCDPIAFTREMLEAEHDDAEELLRVAIGEGFTGYAAEQGEALLINNALDDERGKTIDGTDDVPESMLVVPMLYEGRALGVIVLSQLGFDRFTPDDLQTMTIFAGYAAQAMANATTYEQLVSQSTELARRADSQRRLLEVSERLLSTLDQAGVLELIADGLRDVVDYDNLSIYRADHPTSAMIPVLTRERHAEQVSRYIIPFGRGLMGWAVEHAEPILANDALGDPRALQIPGTPEDPEAVVVVPLVVDGEVLGALNVSRVGGPEVYFSPSDFELIQLFAAQASIALSNADAHHAVSQRAETDALTGLANHGAFQRDLSQMAEAAISGERASDRRLVLLMMDLDRFKSYNDRHGHPAGDALLHRAATAIYGAARSEDRVYRYGGDEFALILPGATPAEGVRVAQRIRRAVARLTAGDPSPVTITVGVAGMPADAVDRASLIAAADSSLYYGKRAGEDRVVRADRLPVEVDNLRGTLEELATALRHEDVHAVEHLVERASQLGGGAHERQESLRDALLAVSRSFDTRGAEQRGHSDRVGRLCASIAAGLRLPESEQHDLELGGRLHALDPAGLAELGRVPSLQEVGSHIAGYRRLVAAGAARSRRISRAQGPVACHVIGVANAYDELVAGVGRSRVGRSQALALLRRDPATWRSEVVDALAGTVAQRRDAGRRRRASDASEREARGAA